MYSRRALGLKFSNVFFALTFLFRATVRQSGTGNGARFLRCVCHGGFTPVSFSSAAFRTYAISVFSFGKSSIEVIRPKWPIASRAFFLSPSKIKSHFQKPK